MGRGAVFHDNRVEVEAVTAVHGLELVSEAAAR
jgi:hypothetical protein